jgi:NAD(P)-dependent dehydrogenase (short-subunit alcohol dehydrogenase family)
MAEAKRHAGRVAVVTGASSGIGYATCKVLAAEGASVVGIARRAERGRALEQEIRDSAGECTFVRGDVSQADDCRQVIETAIEEYDRIDFLINNAATHSSHQFIPTHLVTEGDWDVVVNTNLRGTFFCCRYALEHMKRQQSGVIINVSSNNAVSPTAGMVAYNSSKAAILQLSRTIAVEYYKDHIRCTAITLGGVDTAKAYEGGLALNELFLGPEAPDIDRTTFSQADLLSPDQVGRAIAMLCDDAAEVFFAAVIAVDGGPTARMASGGAYGAIDIASALERVEQWRATGSPKT